MKVAIFENQYHQVKTHFDIANKLFFNDSITYDHFNSSQDFNPLKKILEYDLVIIDISLSSSSDKDGFDLIEEIIQIPAYPKLLIMTGNSTIVQNLTKKKIPFVPILMKPVDAIDIRDMFNKLGFN